MKAYVFINVEAGKSTEVAARLRAIAGVKSAETCWGLPDVIATVEVKDLKELQDLVLRQIQKVAGVNQTDTHIVWEM